MPLEGRKSGRQRVLTEKARDKQPHASKEKKGKKRKAALSSDESKSTGSDSEAVLTSRKRLSKRRRNKSPPDTINLDESSEEEVEDIFETRGDVTDFDQVGDSEVPASEADLVGVT